LLYTEGTGGGEAKQEAQAREQFYQFKSQTQTLLNELLRAENRLRYVMGIVPTDGRLIVPIDKPTIDKVSFDWREISKEALARNPELRRQKWRVKQRELENIAAKKMRQPRPDNDSDSRPNLADNGQSEEASADDVANPASLSGGGFRQDQRNLARERAKLQEEELSVSHQLADAMRQLELNYELTQTNFNRALAADRQVEAVQAAFEAETVTLDQLLEAQRRRAEAQTSYFRTLLDYQRAIIDVHLRKGSLL
jgi:outer membrane protein TolC